MSLKVTFELADSDLDHFRTIMREAREAAVSMTQEQVLDAAASLVTSVKDTDVPDFVSDRLEKIQVLVDMIRDTEWPLREDEEGRILNALAYFTEPEDLIPDHVPGLGFLDDAIMVELVVRELRHEIEAYIDFRIYREGEEKRRARGGEEADVTREEWLETRRRQLMKRMRDRRRRDREARGRRGGRGFRTSIF